jgi:2-polyprenyl-3-methyl-5-hydroxy-6-metoxy-1,4-benzoquinol methylase
MTRIPAVDRMSRCPLCGGAIAVTDRFGAPALDRCERCGSCFAREGHLDALRSYATDEYLARNEEQLHAEQRRYEARVRLRWVRSHLESGTLLDVGAAAGYFVEAACAAGLSARGIEPSPALGAFARERLGVAVQTAFAEDAPTEDSADAASMWHVLEHAEDPIAMLGAVAANVRAGGLVFLEVPNIASPVARGLGRRWPALAVHEHLTHFTPAGLRGALEQAGLAPVELYTIPRWRYRRPRAWMWPRTLASVTRDCVLARRIVRRDAWRGDLLRAAARR